MYALAFIVVVGLVVLVHELGHFGAARLCGVRVYEFAFGFGPRLFV
ncbi:MAG TPA: RIP metalloprotease RseP, partial [Firmicutes bacterium]|nr:RIP metalloprotease RseP [Bacillota bacterium]